VDGGPRLERSDSGGGPRPPDLKVLKSRSGVRRNASSTPRVGTLSELPQAAARAVRQARLQRALHSVPLGGDIEQDRTSKGRDKGLERGRKGGGDGARERSERSKQTSRQSGSVEKRSGEGEGAKRSFYVKHISYHPN